MRLILGNVILLAALIWTFVEDDGIMPTDTLFFDGELMPTADASRGEPANPPEVWTREADPLPPLSDVEPIEAVESEPEREASLAPLEEDPTTEAGFFVPVEEAAEEPDLAEESVVEERAETQDSIAIEPELPAVDASELDAIAASLEEFYLSRGR